MGYVEAMAMKDFWFPDEQRQTGKSQIHFIVKMNYVIIIIELAESFWEIMDFDGIAQELERPVVEGRNPNDADLFEPISPIGGCGETVQIKSHNVGWDSQICQLDRNLFDEAFSSSYYGIEPRSYHQNSQV